MTMRKQKQKSKIRWLVRFDITFHYDTQSSSKYSSIKDKKFRYDLLYLIIKRGLGHNFKHHFKDLATNLVIILLCFILISLKSINRCTQPATKQYYLLIGKAVFIHMRTEIYEINISSIIWKITNLL